MKTPFFYQTIILWQPRIRLLIPWSPEKCFDQCSFGSIQHKSISIVLFAMVRWNCILFSGFILQLIAINTNKSQIQILIHKIVFLLKPKPLSKMEWKWNGLEVFRNYKKIILKKKFSKICFILQVGQECTFSQKPVFVENLDFSSVKVKNKLKTFKKKFSKRLILHILEKGKEALFTLCLIIHSAFLNNFFNNGLCLF